MAVDKDQDTVLHFACMKEVSHGMHEKTLQLLLNTPAKSLINKQNSKGDTPIMVATRYVRNLIITLFMLMTQLQKHMLSDKK